MTTTTSLPIELHAEIVNNLHHYRDRRTLISTALVSKDWCASSQRILFGVVTDHWDNNEDLIESVTSTHTRFLRTITDFPHHLGPLVHSYSQGSLAHNPEASESIVSQWIVHSSARQAVRMLGPSEESGELWNLMETALPAMVNLKNLYITPSTDSYPAEDDWVSSYKLLRSFNFQLRTLTWRTFFHPQNALPEFLATQHSLVHFETGIYPDHKNLAWLTDGVCPHLISVVCGFNSFSHVARTRNIIAWKRRSGMNDAELTAQCEPSSALDRLKYLSMSDYDLFRQIIGPINLNIILLELTVSPLDTGASSLQHNITYDQRNLIRPLQVIASLSNMPKLGVLVLIRSGSARRPIANLNVTQSAVDCFKRLPSLEYILWRSPQSHGYSYVKLFLSPGSTENIIQEDLDIHHDLGVPWWTVYNV